MADFPVVMSMAVGMVVVVGDVGVAKETGCTYTRSEGGIVRDCNEKEDALLKWFWILRQGN